MAVVFWTSVAVSVLLLGSAYATLRHLMAGGSPADGVVLGIAVLGLAASVLVAGRIVLVSARMQRPPGSGI